MNIHDFHVIMRDIPRTLDLLPHLDSFGQTGSSAGQTGLSTYQGRMEFCLRISSPAPWAEEYFGNEVCRIPFPHLLVKLPGYTRKVFVEKGRCAFYLIYRTGDIRKLLRKNGWDRKLSETELARKTLRQFRITNRMRNLMEELAILAEHTREPGNADRIDQLAYGLVQEFLLAKDPTAQREDFYEAKIRRIASVLQLRFREELSIADLAAEQGLSLRSLFRRWQDVYGDTPYSHLQKLRLEEAVRLLEDTDLPVGHIAGLSGFSDSSYFVRFFKQKTGVTPARYRKMKSNRPPFIRENSLPQ